MAAEAEYCQIDKCRFNELWLLLWQNRLLAALCSEASKLQTCSKICWSLKQNTNHPTAAGFLNRETAFEKKVLNATCFISTLINNKIINYFLYVSQYEPNFSLNRLTILCLSVTDFRRQNFRHV